MKARHRRNPDLLSCPWNVKGARWMSSTSSAQAATAVTLSARESSLPKQAKKRKNKGAAGPKTPKMNPMKSDENTVIAVVKGSSRRR